MATVIYENPPPRVVGLVDGGVSDHLKVWIMNENVCVVGALAEGTARQLQVNWDSAFEGANADSTRFATLAAIAQETHNITSVTSLNSTQLFKGSPPHTFPVVINLYALRNAKTEVVDAIAALETMAAANLLERTPFEISEREGEAMKIGEPPSAVTLNIGAMAIYDECVIESVDTPLDGPKTSEGYLTRATVTLNIQSKSSINKKDIQSTFK